MFGMGIIWLVVLQEDGLSTFIAQDFLAHEPHRINSHILRIHQHS